MIQTFKTHVCLTTDSIDNVEGNTLYIGNVSNIDGKLFLYVNTPNKEKIELQSITLKNDIDEFKNKFIEVSEVLENSYNPKLRFYVKLDTNGNPVSESEEEVVNYFKNYISNNSTTIEPFIEHIIESDPTMETVAIAYQNDKTVHLVNTSIIPNYTTNTVGITKCIENTILYFMEHISVQYSNLTLLNERIFNFLFNNNLLKELSQDLIYRDYIFIDSKNNDKSELIMNNFSKNLEPFKELHIHKTIDLLNAGIGVNKTSSVCDVEFTFNDLNGNRTIYLMNRGSKPAVVKIDAIINSDGTFGTSECKFGHNYGNIGVRIVSCNNNKIVVSLTCGTTWYIASSYDFTFVKGLIYVYTSGFDKYSTIRTKGDLITTPMPELMLTSNINSTDKMSQGVPNIIFNNNNSGFVLGFADDELYKTSENIELLNNPTFTWTVGGYVNTRNPVGATTPFNPVYEYYYTDNTEAIDLNRDVISGLFIKKNNRFVCDNINIKNLDSSLRKLLLKINSKHLLTSAYNFNTDGSVNYYTTDYYKYNSNTSINIVNVNEQNWRPTTDLIPMPNIITNENDASEITVEVDIPENRISDGQRFLLYRFPLGGAFNNINFSHRGDLNYRYKYSLTTFHSTSKSTSRNTTLTTSWITAWNTSLTTSTTYTTAWTTTGGTSITWNTSRVTSEDVWNIYIGSRLVLDNTASYYGVGTILGSWTEGSYTCRRRVVQITQVQFAPYTLLYDVYAIDERMLNYTTVWSTGYTTDRATTLSTTTNWVSTWSTAYSVTTTWITSWTEASADDYRDSYSTMTSRSTTYYRNISLSTSKSTTTSWSTAYITYISTSKSTTVFNTTTWSTSKETSRTTSFITSFITTYNTYYNIDGFGDYKSSKPQSSYWIELWGRVRSEDGYLEIMEIYGQGFGCADIIEEDLVWTPLKNERLYEDNTTLLRNPGEIIIPETIVNGKYQRTVVSKQIEVGMSASWSTSANTTISTTTTWDTTRSTITNWTTTIMTNKSTSISTTTTWSTARATQESVWTVYIGSRLVYDNTSALYYVGSIIATWNDGSYICQRRVTQVSQVQFAPYTALYDVYALDERKLNYTTYWNTSQSTTTTWSSGFNTTWNTSNSTTTTWSTSKATTTTWSTTWNTANILYDTYIIDEVREIPLTQNDIYGADFKSNFKMYIALKPKGSNEDTSLISANINSPSVSNASLVRKFKATNPSLTFTNMFTSEKFYADLYPNKIGAQSPYTIINNVKYYASIAGLNTTVLDDYTLQFVNDILYLNGGEYFITKLGDHQITVGHQFYDINTMTTEKVFNTITNYGNVHRSTILFGVLRTLNMYQELTKIKSTELKITIKLYDSKNNLLNEQILFNTIGDNLYLYRDFESEVFRTTISQYIPEGIDFVGLEIDTYMNCGLFEVLDNNNNHLIMNKLFNLDYDIIINN